MTSFMPLVRCLSALALGLHGLSAGATLLLQRMPTPFDRIIALDSHLPSGQLLATAYYPTGLPGNLQLLQAQGPNQGHSSLAGLMNEVDLVTVKPGHTIGDAVGTAFVAGVESGSSSPALYRVSADGSRVTRLATLPGRSNSTLRLALDATGLWGGRLIVTSRNGEVFAVDGNGTVETLATGAGDLQGLTVLPDDRARYGRFAGCIMAGTEGPSTVAATTHFWCRNASGGVEHLTRSLGGLRLEDITVIDGGNLYAVNFAQGMVTGAAADQFADMVGDLLVSQEFTAGVGVQSQLFRLRLGAGGDDFEVLPLDHALLGNTLGVNGLHFEDIVFSRLGLGPIAAVPDATRVPTPATWALMLLALPLALRASRGR